MASPASLDRPLRDEVAQLEGAFVAAVGGRDVHGAVSELLRLDELIERRVRAGDDSADLHAARATLRALIVRLGDAATDGLRDPHDTVGPFVDALLEVRASARRAGDWTTADLVRDRLVAAEIELHDGPAGTTWTIRPGS